MRADPISVNRKEKDFFAHQHLNTISTFRTLHHSRHHFGRIDPKYFLWHVSTVRADLEVVDRVDLYQIESVHPGEDLVWSEQIVESRPNFTELVLAGQSQLEPRTAQAHHRPTIGDDLRCRLVAAFDRTDLLWHMLLADDTNLVEQPPPEVLHEHEVVVRIALVLDDTSDREAAREMGNQILLRHDSPRMTVFSWTHGPKLCFQYHKNPKKSTQLKKSDYRAKLMIYAFYFY